MQPSICADRHDSDYGSWVIQKDRKTLKVSAKANRDLKRKVEDVFSTDQAVIDSPEQARLDLEAGWDSLGLVSRSLVEVQIFNAALYIEDIAVPEEKKRAPEWSEDKASEELVKRKKALQPEKVDLTKFTPQKIEDFKRLGGQTPDLRKSIAVLKALQVSPIRDITNFPRSEIIFSPAARMVMSREDIREARDIGLVTHLPPLATAEPVEAETEEQRIAREARQLEEFNAVESQLDSVPQLLEEKYEAALKPWKSYFAYVDLKKKSILSGAEKKMRWPDLVGAFLKYVAPHMTMIEIDGYEVYFTFETLNFKRKGRLNLNYEDMKLGFCPMGADMELMNYHHVTKLDPSTHKIAIDEATKIAKKGPYKIALIPNFLHEEYSYYLHCESDTCVLPQNPLDRSQFDKSRKRFNEKIVELYFKD